MAYTSATKYPSNSVLTVFQWSRPDAANPRLAAPISATATTITFTDAPKDYTDTIQANGFLMGVRNNNGFVETIYVPAGTLSADGKTATGVVRGIRPDGLDYTTGDTDSFAAAHEQDSPVFCNVSAIYHYMMIAALQGTIASGAENWKIGAGADNDITVYAANGDANEPFWRYDSATSAWVYSNDGVSSTPFGTGTGVTGGDGITVTAGDIDIDVTDTTIFKNSSAGAGDANIVPILDAAGRLDSTITGATYTEINQLSGTTNIVEANTFFGATDLTGAEAETLSDGSDASTLHSHDAVGNLLLSQRHSYRIGGLAANSSGGSTGTTGFKSYVVTNSANNAIATIGGSVYNATSTPLSVHDKNPKFMVSGAWTAATAQEGFIGFVNTSFTGTSLENAAMTLDHFGFVVADGTLYISCADGTTQSKTDISGTVPSVTAGHDFRATFDGTTATFYVDGSSVGSLNTNVPNGDLTGFYCAVIADASAAAKRLDINGSGAVSYDM